MPINTYPYKNNCPQGQYRTKENHLIIQILVKQRLFPQRILPSRWMSPRFRPKNTQ